MSYSIVADQSDVRIFNRAATAQDALALAARRRSAGASAVYVYGADWTLIEAPSLHAAAQAAGAVDKPENSVAAEARPRVGGRGEDPGDTKARGRVRVFRGRRADAS